jgi:alanyl-tRNA synthetase
MKIAEIRKCHEEMYNSFQHHHLGSFSVVPENDTGALFTTAGMHPLVNYLKGDEKSPFGNRLSSCQKVVRTTDLDEVGDDTHLTFFEMLGNWSVGDYGKSETIEMSLNFIKLIDGLPLEHLWITVFEGDDEAPKDTEAAQIWEKLGIPSDRIIYLGKKDNWWSMGDVGLCGPCSEMFIDTKPSEPVGPGSILGDDPMDRFVEIGNNVFMDFFRKEDGTLDVLPKSNIDVGLGLERLAVISEGLSTIYDLPSFIDAFQLIQKETEQNLEHNSLEWRIISEHSRALLGILGDQVSTFPSNTGRGYVVRQIIRRAYTECSKIGVDPKILINLPDVFLPEYANAYPEFESNMGLIKKVLTTEVENFSKVLARGERCIVKIFNKLGENKLNAEHVFDLKQTHGIPAEVALQITEKLGGTVSMDGYDKLFEEHRLKSK